MKLVLYTSNSQVFKRETIKWCLTTEGNRVLETFLPQSARLCSTAIALSQITAFIRYKLLVRVHLKPQTAFIFS